MKILPGWTVLAAIALGAIAAWPLFAPHAARAANPYVAPVQDDYDLRDQTVSFYERRVANDKRDQISATLLAGEYMQRYREQGDVGDLARAIAQGSRALRLQPANNAAADGVLGSAYTAMHMFARALVYERRARVEQPNDSNAPAQMASLDMELGDYTGASKDLERARSVGVTATTLAIEARYDELTGHSDRAEALLRKAMAQSDSVYDNGAQGRAWYHFRLGEVLFSQGKIGEAKQREREALRYFPRFELAYRALARFCWATKDWPCARDAAVEGAAVVPVPETLGYEADAQEALGDRGGAARTRALVVAIERLGNAYHLNDRLLAVYYSEHGIRLDDAYRIAQREVRLRGNEVYAQDTLAWAAAMDGRWGTARAAALAATRFGTQDPRILFHAGTIAMHFHQDGRATRLLQGALALNPRFDPFYAQKAREMLGSILSR